MAGMRDVLLVVLVSLSAVAATLALLSAAARGRTRRDPAWFRCRAAHPRAGRVRWERATTRACWVDRVLLVRVGVLRLRTLAIAVDLPADARLEPDVAGRVHRLGALPQILHLRTADGTRLDLAAAHADRTRLVGPFLAMAIPGLPTAPPGRDPRRRR